MIYKETLFTVRVVKHCNRDLEKLCHLHPYGQSKLGWTGLGILVNTEAGAALSGGVGLKMS